jgi:AcrR family transcriptional regulator
MPGKSQARLVRPRGVETGREVIMDAAERLFAERGIEAVSLRTINLEAGYSVAALHYHFGSRDGLVRALLERAQPPMLQARTQLLAPLYASPEPALAQIVDALVRPLTAGMFDDFTASLARLRFLVRLSFDRSPYVTRLLEESIAVFRPLLRRALPQLDARTITRRWLLAVDLAQQALANAAAHLDCAAGTAARASELERFVRELIAFIAAALRAPG